MSATEAIPAQPAPLALSRIVHAPRETVFAAWGTAEHVKRWFSPETFTVPDATVEPWTGGKFDVRMRAPDGTEHWTRGIFAEFTPHTRLVIDMHVVDAARTKRFRAYTEVNFADALGGTRLDVVQTYTFLDPMAAPMLAGAPEGWRTTLDKLEREAVRMQGGETVARSVVHATFQVKRRYDAPAARVWRALTDPAAKAAWFAGPPGSWTLLERTMDVRSGACEHGTGLLFDALGVSLR